MIAHLIYLSPGARCRFRTAQPTIRDAGTTQIKVREASRKREQDVSSENEDELPMPEKVNAIVLHGAGFIAELTGAC